MGERRPPHGDRPLRIVMVATARFRAVPPYPGGLEAFVARLAAGMVGRGHEVIVVDGGDGPDGADAPGRRADLHDHDDELRRDGCRLRDATAAAIRSLRPDVVHHHAPVAEPLELIERPGPQWMVTVHTPPLEPVVEAVCAGDAPAVAPSEFTAAQWRRAGCPVEVVPNGIDRRVFRPGPTHGSHLVWTGRLVPEKAPDLAIDTARALEVPIVLAGPRHDPDYWADEIRPRLSPRCRYVGHLDDAATARLVADAAVALVTPRWDEPFGLVVPESLACGTPVAAIARGALPELVTPHVGALARAATVPAVAGAAIEAIGADRARCRRESARWGLERTLDEYERRYRALVGSELVTS